MSNKLLTLVVLGVIGLSASITASAQRTETIRGEGFIGISEGGGGIPNEMIMINVPTEVNWMVTELNNGQIQSGDYNLENESPSANIAFRLVSYVQSNNVTIPGTLTLNLLVDNQTYINNIVGSTNNPMYNRILLSEAGLAANQNGIDRVSLGFGGTYVGTFPATALVPTYNMVLEFVVDSYELVPTP